MSTRIAGSLSRIIPSRRTVKQLLDASRKDTDAVSVFALGTSWDDTDDAILVVKGRESVRYLIELAQRQGLLTAGKDVERALS